MTARETGLRGCAPPGKQGWRQSVTDNDIPRIRAIHNAFNEIHGQAVIVPQEEGDGILEFLIKTAVVAVDAVCLYTHADADDKDRRDAFARVAALPTRPDAHRPACADWRMFADQNSIRLMPSDDINMHFNGLYEKASAETPEGKGQLERLIVLACQALDAVTSYTQEDGDGDLTAEALERVRDLVQLAGVSGDGRPV